MFFLIMETEDLNYFNSILAVGGTSKKVIPSGNPDSPYKTANMVSDKIIKTVANRNEKTLILSDERNIVLRSPGRRRRSRITMVKALQEVYGKPNIDAPLNCFPVAYRLLPKVGGIFRVTAYFKFPYESALVNIFPDNGLFNKVEKRKKK